MGLCKIEEESTLTEDILLFTEVSLPGHANPYGIHQHIACKSFARIKKIVIFLVHCMNIFFDFSRF